MSVQSSESVEVSGDELLRDTNRLLHHVGISSKRIKSLEELTRVSSSMFVTVFETLFQTRLEKIVRSPKVDSDYVTNCQIVIDALSRKIDVDLQHITGASIVRGNRKSLSNLVTILLRIASLASNSDTARIGEHRGFLTSGPSDSCSISTHESDFDYGHSRRSSASSSDRDFFYLENRRTSHRPATAQPPLGFVEESPVVNIRPTVATSHDDMDLIGLRGMLSDYQQREKLNAAKARRDAHKRLRTSQARSSNYEALQKSCIALQTRWLDDEMRKSQSQQLQETHKEDVLIRKMQRNIMDQMYANHVSESSEVRERIKQMRQEAKWHFKSLQNLFEDRIRMLRENEKAAKGSHEAEIQECRRLTDDLRHSYDQKQKQILETRQNLLQQKQARMSHLRHEAHRQLLTMIAKEPWSESLRSSYSSGHQHKSARDTNRRASSRSKGVRIRR